MPQPTKQPDKSLAPDLGFGDDIMLILNKSLVRLWQEVHEDQGDRIVIKKQIDNIIFGVNKIAQDYQLN